MTQPEKDRKMLKDYLLEGGVKGRYFKNAFTTSSDAQYEVLKIFTSRMTFNYKLDTLVSICYRNGKRESLDLGQLLDDFEVE